jgi:hypothetical protein
MDIKPGDIIKAGGGDTQWTVLSVKDDEVTVFDPLDDFPTTFIEQETISVGEINSVESRNFDPQMGDYIHGLADDLGCGQKDWIEHAQIFEEREDGSFLVHWLKDDVWRDPDHLFAVVAREDIFDCFPSDDPPVCSEGEFCSATDEGLEKIGVYNKKRRAEANKVLFSGIAVAAALAILVFAFAGIWTSLLVLILGGFLINKYGRWHFSGRPYKYQKRYPHH